MLSADRIVAAVARLDPESRALVELSARRGMSPDDIAAVLDVEPDEVLRRLEDAVAQVADDLEAESAEVQERLAELDEADWRGETAAAEVEADEADEPEEPARDRGDTAEIDENEPAERPTQIGAFGHSSSRREPRPAASRPAARRDRGPLALALLALLAVVALIVGIAVAGGGDDEPKTAGGGSDRTTTAEKDTTETDEIKTEEAGGPVRQMERLNGTFGRGTAQLVDADGSMQLRLKVSRFLQPRGGGYAVWLANSPDDARRLYATDDTTIERDLRLPSGYDRYTFVEVARAIPELNSDHSGLTLLRVRTEDLSP